jgi:hypothetical protein
LQRGSWIDWWKIESGEAEVAALRHKIAQFEQQSNPSVVKVVNPTFDSGAGKDDWFTDSSNKGSTSEDEWSTDANV